MAVHDDPVIGLDRNPFIPDICVSVGGTIFTIWKKDFKVAPIFWRRRPTRITTAKWSLDRAAVLFLTLEDGTFEAWDFLSKLGENVESEFIMITIFLFQPVQTNHH